MDESKKGRRPRGERAAARPVAQGLDARRAAVDAVEAVLTHGRPLEEALEPLARGLEPRDRGLARMIAATVLRRLGSLRELVRGALDKGLPERAARVETLLLAGAAQLVLMDVPDHAAVATSVDLAGEKAATAGYKGLVNAVLRRLARDGAERFAALDPADLDIPGWMMAGWREAYGEEQARRIALASLVEAPLDITARSDAASWAERLGGHLLPTGSIRLAEAGDVTALPGFAEGAWWVQDAAAALPARLLDPQPGERVADLCAAPGGKTAQLAAAGAQVTAVDRSAPRLKRLRQNLARLGLEADIVEADAARLEAPIFETSAFDAVLLDAPCSASGTIRRHPDLAWSKQPSDVATLAALQSRLLERTAALVKPGGRLVYATCSLEPSEGEWQIDRFLSAHPDYAVEPVRPGEAGIAADWITAQGHLRTLPFQLPEQDGMPGGIDGFFAARLRRR